MKNSKFSSRTPAEAQQTLFRSIISSVFYFSHELPFVINIEYDGVRERLVVFAWSKFVEAGAKQNVAFLLGIIELVTLKGERIF